MADFIKTKSFTLAVYQRGNSDSKKLALVLPGKLDTKDYPHMRAHVDFLAEKGFLALSFDPPGTWESHGSIELYNMTNYLKAINELIEYFGNLPTVLVGHSRGGTMAMLAGAQNKFVTTIIAVMAHSSPAKAIPRPVLDKVSKRDNPKGGVKEFVLPKSFYEDEDKFDALPGLINCGKKKLFIFGKRDALVPPQEVRVVFDKSAFPKEIAQIDSKHDYRRSSKKIEEVNSIIGRFLEKNF